MKLYSWNVNGLRAIMKKGFTAFLDKEKPDIICLQETKISESARAKEEFDFEGYEEYLNPAERPGYSGTATLVAEKNFASQSGLTASQAVKPLERFSWDDEGRVHIFELPKFYLVNCYFPNANHELSRLGFKIKFNDRLLAVLKNLEKKKPVIICGDFNVAHQPIDLARPKDNERNAGYTRQERAWMTKFLKAGFIDAFRHFYPNKIQYSWWSYKFFARAKNIGWRIDYFCLSKSIIKQVKAAYILDKVAGSDHCPVGITLDI